MDILRIAQNLAPTLYEDEHLLAVGKPAGVDAVGRDDTAGAGLTDVLTKVRGQEENLQVVNRLSRYESGVLLVAKDSATLRYLRSGVKSNRVAQKYVAVVLGSLSKPSVVIDPGHGASRGRQGKKNVGGRNRMRASASMESVSASSPKRSNGPRRTTVSVLKRGPTRTLVRCLTTVENTHALRAQLRAARLRLLGDNVHNRAPGRPSGERLGLHLAEINFRHPRSRSNLSVSCPDPKGLTSAVDGTWDYERPMSAALLRRLPGIADDDIDSFRLLTGAVENLKGLAVEQYANVVILQVLEEEPKLISALPDIARWYKKMLQVDAVYVKRFVKDRSGTDEKTRRSLHAPRPLVGRPAPPEITITERGLSFLIRPSAGFSVGLFPDQRENRSRVRSLAKGKDVLNLFAYTCSFSVAAAAGGARSTVSVDLSPKHLEWGRANFALNRLDLEDHQFIKSDAADYLKRARRQERRFHLVILDPPSFAHGRKGGRKFMLVKDLPGLVTGAASLLTAGGMMMISTNYRRLSMRGLHELVEKGAAGRRFQVTATPPLPFDFAMDADHAKTIFVRFPQSTD